MREILYKSESAPVDIAGGLRELTDVLWENRGGRDEDREDTMRETSERSRAPCREEWQEPSGFFKDWTDEQREHGRGGGR